MSVASLLLFKKKKKRVFGKLGYSSLQVNPYLGGLQSCVDLVAQGCHQARGLFLALCCVFHCIIFTLELAPFLWVK